MSILLSVASERGSANCRISHLHSAGAEFGGSILILDTRRRMRRVAQGIIPVGFQSHRAACVVVRGYALPCSPGRDRSPNENGGAPRVPQRCLVKLVENRTSQPRRETIR